MTTRRRLVPLAAIGLSLGLIAAACGGDDDDDANASTSAADTTAADTTAAPSDTTAAPTDTTAGATTTAAPAADAFTLDGADCPADSTTPIADGAPIKIAFVGPQTGPLAGFGIIGQGMKAYFDKVNSEGGVEGHQIEFITKDDAYDPARTKTGVQELLEKDKINMSVLQVGTPNVAAVRDLYEAACVPQAYVGTGFPNWGDPANFQYTVGGILAYNTEAKIWLEYIAETSPGAKVGVLVYNNDFGKSYQKVIEADAEAAGLEIVNVSLHEPTSTLNNGITAILAAGPDVVIGATTATFCGEAAKQLRQGGFDGPFIVSATCFNSQFLAPAAEAAANVFGVGYLKDPTDPQWADDAAVKQYLADIAEFGAGAKPEITSVATGYNFASLAVDTIEKAIAGGELSNVTIAQAMWNIDTTLPLAYEGAKFIINGNSDGYGVEYGEVREFIPADGTIKSTGKSYDQEGQTGLFGG